MKICFLHTEITDGSCNSVELPKILLQNQRREPSAIIHDKNGFSLSQSHGLLEQIMAVHTRQIPASYLQNWINGYPRSVSHWRQPAEPRSAK